jgi:hypothetical protein
MDDTTSSPVPKRLSLSTGLRGISAGCMTFSSAEAGLRFQTDDARFADRHDRSDRTHVLSDREEALMQVTAFGCRIGEVATKDIEHVRKPFAIGRQP